MPTPEEVTLHLSVDDAGDDWRARIEPSEITFRPAMHTAENQDRFVRLTSTVQVAARLQAPAYQPERITIEAYTAPGAVYESSEAATQIVAIAGFRPGLEARALEDTVTVLEGEQIHVRAELANLANGPVDASYGAIDAPDGCAVEPVHEAVEIDRHRTREMVFHLACASGAQPGELAVTYEQAYAPDTSIEGPPVR